MQSLTLTKYNNRKVYDPKTSKYVNQTTILKHLKDGVAVHIIDHKTKNDITPQYLRLMLAQHIKKSNAQVPELLAGLGVFS